MNFAIRNIGSAFTTIIICLSFGIAGILDRRCPRVGTAFCAISNATYAKCAIEVLTDVDVYLASLYITAIAMIIPIVLTVVIIVVLAKTLDTTEPPVKIRAPGN